MSSGEDLPAESEEEQKLQEQARELRARIAEVSGKLVDSSVREELMGKLKWMSRFGWLRSIIRILGVGALSNVLGFTIGLYGLRFSEGSITAESTLVVPIAIAALSLPLLIYLGIARAASKRRDNRMKVVQIYAPALPRDEVEVDMPHEPMSYRDGTEAPHARIKRLEAESVLLVEELTAVHVEAEKDETLKQALHASDAQGVLGSLGVPPWLWPIFFVPTALLHPVFGQDSKFAPILAAAILLWFLDAFLRHMIPWRSRTIDTAIGDVSGAPVEGALWMSNIKALAKNPVQVRVAPSTSHPSSAREQAHVVHDEEPELEDDAARYGR